MYQQFFNFNALPFSIAPDPEFIFMSEYHQEGLAHLLYGINQQGGFVALTGEVGTGKTTLCQYLLQQIPENIETALVLNPKLNAKELLATICDELQIKYDQNKQTLKDLIDCLNQHLLKTHAEGKRTVLMIDEAQNLSLDVLEQIRLLTNLETSKSKLLQIILIAQPELKVLLAQTELRQLNQRITARYHLRSLSVSETEKYIKHRLAISGCNETIFNKAAIRHVFKLSGGIPRLINVLCDRALLGAYVANTKTINKKIIQKASKEVFNTAYSEQKKHISLIILGGLLVAALLIVPIKQLISVQSEEQHILLSGAFKKTSQQQNAKQLLINSGALQNKVSSVSKNDFKAFISQQKTSLGHATAMLAKIWNRDITEESGCQEIEQTGLKCLYDKSNWHDLVSLNRPVILEVSMTGSEKSYVVLHTSNQQGKFAFYMTPDKLFTVDQIKPYWGGYYLMFWQPSVDGISIVYPGKNSEAVPWIRKQLRLNKNELSTTLNSNFYDMALKTQVIRFQQSHHLGIDGIVGPRTFIQLNNQSDNYFPTLRLMD